jgi:aspartyl-tRNA(Asn)/glutamyl-tRNA(Gln) amidotransferase subunit A
VTVSELTEAFEAGSDRPTDALHRTLARAHDAGGQIFTTLLDASASEAAAASDERWSGGAALGPLDGVPVAVKDLLHVAGTVPTLGSEVHPEQPSTEDAEVVRRLRRAGAVIVGRTWTHEHAWGITGQHPALGGPVNPYDPTRVTGGSSAGSAAAVARDIVPLAVGTDTAGSIRIPAAWCGVVGWKPTWGWSSVDGVFELAATFDHLGLLGTTVADVAAAHDLLADRPLAAPVAGVRIGSALASTSVGDPRIADHLRAVHHALGLADVVLPDPDRARVVQGVLQPIEALRVHQHDHGWWPAERARFGEHTAARLDLAATIDDEQVAKASSDRIVLADDLDLAMADVDLVLAPIAGCAPSFVHDPDVAPVPVGGPLRDAVLGHTSLQTLFGLPAIALPTGLVDGLPVGVQLFGRRGSDAEVLAAAAVLESRLLA